MVFKILLLIAFASVSCTLVNGQIQSRILGGKNARVGQFPYQVALYTNNNFECGGTIIDRRWIMTAAHCVVVGGVGIKPYPARNVTIRAGSIHRLTGGKLLRAEKIKVKMSFGNFLDDIALVYLNESLVMSDTINKIGLQWEEVPNNSPVNITGWGRLSFNGVNPDILQWNTLSKLSPDSCEKRIGYGWDSILCLAHKENNGICMGDSGGPATYNGKVAGVTNFSNDGCGSKKPDAFAKVSYHRNWIMANMMSTQFGPKRTVIYLTMSLTILSLIALLCLLLCGTHSAQPISKVVGGKDAEIGQFPHQVALFKDGSFTCGGSIISSRYVLTAAHCVVVGNGIETLPAKYFTVRVGSIQRLAGGKLMSIKTVTVRQSYGNFLDDVALLELETELVFSKNIQKIDLYDAEVPKGEEIVISGWGRIVHGGAIPHRLQYNTLSALDGPSCDLAIGMGHDQIICLAHDRNNGACNGDSGGPATYQGKLVGVAGFVYGGCGSANPDGYAKVKYHLDWIHANMH
ncbi:transmembrane protease serine 9-like [Episyrphus balteatus]|uniref:transmembrane protease serine 9-like n=1 Tax=Episyrphus balteatus TaxID=286459 RepID=UPI0024869A90|nr:transmembrane protease serine 9-like [Episyrphus balteatus]